MPQQPTAIPLHVYRVIALPLCPIALSGMKEDKESWSDFLKNLRGRGLKGTELFITDKCQGLVESVGEIFPEARWQRCVVHWYRNVLRTVPKTKWREVAAMLKAIHAQEDRPIYRTAQRERVPRRARSPAGDVTARPRAGAAPGRARPARVSVRERA